MAGEVGHVVYGARVVAYLGDKVKGTAFWTGTLFPDIRHLGIVSRRQTHVSDASLETLVGETDFITGMRAHSWIDTVRIQYMEEANTKEILPWHPFVPHALKLVEDEYLYDRFDDWNLIHRALNRISDEELHYVNSVQHIQRWHTSLQDYFKKAPDDDSRFKLSCDIGLSEQSAEEINAVVGMLKQDEQTRKLINRFVHHLEYLLR